jgi:uncharacterized membrane protein
MKRARPGLRTALAFALLGPAIGASVFSLVSFLTATFRPRPALPDARTVLFMLTWSYAVGVIPAALSGFTCAWIMRRLDAWRLGWLLRALIGALTGALFSALLAFALLGADLPQLSGLTALCGAVAGAILATRFPRDAWLERQES